VVCEPNSITDADVATLRKMGLTDRAILELTTFVAFRLTFRRSMTRSTPNLTRSWPVVSRRKSEMP
jgi:hypothetical protein